MRSLAPLTTLSILGLLSLAVAATPACASLAHDRESEAEPGPLGSTSSALTALTKVTGFGSNPGGLEMYEYAPAGLAAGAPAVLVLHGCMQGAQDASTTGWIELADELGFLVVFPQQVTGNNPMRCFNWAGEYGDPANVQRGKGENQSLKEMTDKAIAAHGTDPKRIFVVGFSAGGAEAAVAAATWPDVFAGAAIIAGVPYNCTTTYAEVSGCQKPGKNKTPAEWGGLVRAAHSGFAGPWPRVSIWQGSADTIVGTANRTELVEQWTDVHGLSGPAAVTDTVDGQAHAAWKNASGAIVVETYEVAGMAHAVPIDTSAKCGSAGAYALNVGICAARRVAQFFGLSGAAAGDAGAGADSGKPSGPLSSSSSTGGASGEGGAGSSGSSGSAGALPDDDSRGGAGATCAVARAPGIGSAGVGAEQAGLVVAAAAIALACASRLGLRQRAARGAR